MTAWEYLHVRATVGIRDHSPPFSFERTRSAVFLINGKQLDLKVEDTYRVDIQDSVVAVINQIGAEGWELVSHADRVRDDGFGTGPTEYTFFFKRPKQ